MTVTVKFVRRRPGGRVTVRPNIFDKRELTIGRGADCDIFLPDLRVSLRHARLIQLNDKKAAVEALSDKRIKSNGATLRRCEIVIDRGAEIGVGPYAMTIEAGEAPGDMTVSVELAEPLTEPAAPEEEEKAFSLAGGLVGKRAAAWALFLSAILVFLILPIFAFFLYADDRGVGGAADAPPPAILAAADRPWLAGALASAHANLAEDCQACHVQPFVRVEDSACLSCHDELRDHAAPGRLFTAQPAQVGLGAQWRAKLQAALDIPQGRCGSCHFEHNGSDGIFLDDQALCAECHGGLDQRLTDTELLNTEDFRRAHPEFRPRIVIATGGEEGARFARVSMADDPRENSGLIYPHDFHLKDAEVARKLATLPAPAKAAFGETLDCLDCHKLEAGGGLFAPIEMESQCAACHSLVFAVAADGAERLLPHGQPREVVRVLDDFYLAKASEFALSSSAANILTRQLGAEDRARRDRLREDAYSRARADSLAMATRVFSEGGICEKCHLIAPPQAGGNPRDYRVTPVVFSDPFMPRARFSHEAHMTGEFECGDCHAAESSDKAQDVLLPGVATCRQCHGGANDHRLIASPCLTCHIYHAEDGAPHMAPRLRRAAREGSSP